jgi:hypothetical protein
MAMVVWFSGVTIAAADIYINVMAVNGAPTRKETPVHYNLPGDLKAEDILDASGLQLEYNPNDGNYVATATVALEPKETKTFRIRIRDIWKMSPQEIETLKEQINKGYEQIGKQYDPANAEVLKQQLMQRLDYLSEQQSSKAPSIEKRIDDARAYRSEMQRILDQALAVDYWRSQPGENKEKTIRYKIEVENPTTSQSTKVKHKYYMPEEVKPQHVLDAQGFEVRFDQQKNQPFLFKEEEIPQGEKRAYIITIMDVWSVPQRDIDYLRKRAAYAYDFLKTSKYKDSATILFDGANSYLVGIEQSQGQNREIKEHISAFRANQKSLNSARTNVENLEKLLAILREDLEKSKVKNVLQRMKSLNSVSAVAKQMFEKKPEQSTTWTYISWVLAFVGVLSIGYFVTLMLRSKGKSKAPAGSEPPKSEPPATPK